MPLKTILGPLLVVGLLMISGPLVSPIALPSHSPLGPSLSSRPLSIARGTAAEHVVDFEERDNSPGPDRQGCNATANGCYAVDFFQSGLPQPALENWSVTLDGATQSGTDNTAFTFWEPNGTYSYSGTCETNCGAFPPIAGSVTVDGQPPGATGLFWGTVGFDAAGLPSGTPWSVTLNGFTMPAGPPQEAAVTFYAPSSVSGESNYLVSPVAGYSANLSGTVNITNGTGSVSIYFTPTVYPVTFGESGLPTDACWSVSLNGSIQEVCSDTVTFQEKNGSYPYSIAKVPGYTPSPSSGVVSVDGAGYIVSIVFSPIPAALFAVTFFPDGLLPDTTWSVTLNGSTESDSTGGQIQFSEPNGTYQFYIELVPYYTSSPSSGTITVNGADLAQTITFTATQLLVNASATPSTVDVGQALDFEGSAAGGVPPYKWSWTFGDGSASDLQSPQHAYSAPETYSYVLEVTDQDGNSSGTGGMIVVNPLPTLTCGASALETDVGFGITFSVEVVGGTAPFEFRWDFDDNTPITSAQNPTHTFSAADSYDVTVQARDITGELSPPCHVLIAVNGPPVLSDVQVDPSPACRGYPVDFSVDVENGTDPISYAWDFGDSGGSSEPAPEHTYITASTYLASVTVQDGLGLTAQITDIQVAVSLCPSDLYPVVFTESGASEPGHPWTIGLTGHPSIALQRSSVTIPLANGSYVCGILAPAGYALAPFQGPCSFMVQGQEVDISIAFVHLFTVDFNESGLPSGVEWWSNVTNAGSNSNITSNGTGVVRFDIPNGTYHYEIGVANPNWQTANQTGNVSVSGAEVSVNVTFLPAFPVTFVQHGLPADTPWQVDLLSTSLTSTALAISGANTVSRRYDFASNSSTLRVYLPNGTYQYSVTVTGGATWSIQNATGTVVVNGDSLSPPILVAFSHMACGNCSPTSIWLWIALGFVAAIFVAAVLVVRGGRHKT